VVGVLGPSWALAGAGFRRFSSYRMSMAAGAFTNSVFGLLRASVTLGAIGAAGGTLAGYDAQQGLAYAWITQALIGPVHIFTWQELSLRIRTGDVAVDLARPMDLQLQYLAADLGRAVYVLIPRGVPPLLVGALTFGLVLPTVPWPYLAGLASLALGVGVSFGCRFMVNLSAFWLLDIRGVLTLYMVVSNVLSGMFVPVAWFPDWLRLLARLTPFPSMIQYPADLFSGRVTGVEAVQVLGIQAFWLAVTLGAGRLVLRSALRRLVVQGG
jgi:ABC-2 type transport system permease protein